jgi:hypothetical protein
MAFRTRIRHVRDGEPAKASVINRPVGEVQDNAQFLYDQLRAESLGERTIAPGVPLSEDVLIGTPVYYDADDGEFKPALDGLTYTNGAYVPTSAANVVGICLTKDVLTGDILTAGSFEIDDVDDLENSVDGTPEEGLYFLSASVPGRMEQRASSTGVLIGILAAGRFLFNPQLRLNSDQHRHYAFSLHPYPAGSTTPGDPHTITSANPSERGWLPASHPSFDGNAPDGAVFGYNIAADEDLAAVWPPMPPESARLFWYKDLVEDTYSGLIPQGPELTYTIDVNGIWWHQDAYGFAPWFKDLDTDNPPGSPTDPPSDDGTQPEMTLFFTTPFATDGGFVEKLKNVTGSPLTFVDLQGNAAEQGVLCPQWDWDHVLADGDDTAGDLVFKSIADDGKFERGPVVESIRGGGALQITASRETTDGGDTVYQGELTMTVDLNQEGREIAPQIYDPVDAEQTVYLSIPTMAFPATRASSIRWVFDIADSMLPADPHVKIKVVLASRVTGTLPALTFTGRIIPEPTEGTQAAIPTTSADFAITLNTNLAITSGNQRTIVGTTAIEVAAGDRLLVIGSRGSSDGFGGEVLIPRIVAVLQSGDA